MRSQPVIMGPHNRNGPDPTWDLALATLATERQLDHIELLPDRAVALHALEVSTSATQAEHAVWLGGARGKLRAGIQQVIDARLGAGQRWLLLWTEGRWPRGASSPPGDRDPEEAG